MSSRSRLSSLAATVLIAPVALVATATPAQAAPDPGNMACDQPYVSHQQVDRTHVRVRVIAKICRQGLPRMLGLSVNRGGKHVKGLDKQCEYGSICKRKFVVYDPKGAQTWRATGSVYTMEEGIDSDYDRWNH